MECVGFGMISVMVWIEGLLCLGVAQEWEENHNPEGLDNQISHSLIWIKKEFAGFL